MTTATTTQPKRTPLFAEHERLGAKMVPFAGYNMPVRYSSDIEEHMAVRKSLGVFDVSHMGEFLVRGPGAVDFASACLPTTFLRSSRRIEKSISCWIRRRSTVSFTRWTTNAWTHSAR